MITVCKGIPGGSGAHRVADPDDLIAGICNTCEKLLTSAKSWGSSTEVAARNNRNSGNSVGIHLPGSLDPATRTRGASLPKNKPSEWRNYPDAD